MLNDLDNNDSILLLYLAGEMSAAERAEVEQRLQGDAAMRAELDRLRDALVSAEHAMTRLDEVTLPPIPDAVAVRQITRMVRQWQADQFQPALAIDGDAAERTLRFPWWAYPLATAAAIMLALLVWWVNLDEFGAGDTAQQYVSGTGSPWGWGGRFGGGGGDFGQMLASVYEEPSPLEEFWAENLTESFDNADDLLDDVVVSDPLDEAEQDLLALWDRRSDFPDALFIPTETENP